MRAKSRSRAASATSRVTSSGLPSSAARVASPTFASQHLPAYLLTAATDDDVDEPDTHTSGAMETLRRLAETEFIHYDKFEEHVGPQLRLIEIHADSSGTTSYINENLTEGDLLSRLVSSEASSSRAVDASCQLVTMRTSSRGTATEGVGMSKAGFLQLIDAFQIDRCILQLVQLNSYGLHMFSNGHDGCTYFVADMRYELFWSFDPTTMRTRGILIVRRPDDRYFGAKYFGRALEKLVSSVKQQSAHIFNPYMLLFVALVDLASWVEESRYGEWKRIIDFEHTTGYGPYGGLSNGKAELPIDHITSTAKAIEATSVHFARFQRHMDIIDALIAELEDGSTWRNWFQHPTAKRQLELCERDTCSLC
ncbi:Uu.00g125880.m01.CDS01 [Anthostomella pinea]|uniref:Uu.00g125880.m01.CDS01 n=1 Tax=Anthostomella pinea TaxID=933095 RepID=A0AAI8VHS3_9PEZI|nr:Uu.00g125880.m01.CDS01 [Anthostomella pinea]